VERKRQEKGAEKKKRKSENLNERRERKWSKGGQ
jgi:hypothetical protein